MSVRIIHADVLARLRRGPASEASLARWCDMPQARFIRPVLQSMCRERCIRDVGGRYALPVNPLSPARSITIGRGSRWPLLTDLPIQETP